MDHYKPSCIKLVMFDGVTYYADMCIKYIG